MKRILTLCTLALLTLNLQAASYVITDFGAVADGKTVNTTAINKVIETCHKAGGGTVIVPAGVFITGTLYLKSNVNLHLDNGSELKASSSMTDFRTETTKHGLIYALDAENISITGRGTINGNGTHFHIASRPHVASDYDPSYSLQGENYMKFNGSEADGPIGYDDRPGMVIVLMHCSRVMLRDFKITDASEWSIRLGECDDVLVTGLTIDNNMMIPNSDGIHCTTSRNIRISDCDLRCGDDCIIVTGFGDEIGVSGFEFEKKATNYTFGNKTRVAENVTVTNCVMTSRSAGIRIGYGINHIRNCTFSNLIIYNSNRGIGVFARDAGNIDNIRFSNISIQTRLHAGHWWGKGEPIHVSAYPESDSTKLGTISNIYFTDIRIQSETGVVVYGYQGSPIKNLQLSNIQLDINNGPMSKTVGGNFDLRPVKDLDKAIFKHSIPGVFCSGVENLTLRNIDLNWGNNLPDYFTSALHVEQFNNVLIDGFKGRNAASRSAVIELSNGKGFSVVNCVAKPGSSLFCELFNATEAGWFKGNDVRNARRIAEPMNNGINMSDNLVTQ